MKMKLSKLSGGVSVYLGVSDWQLLFPTSLPNSFHRIVGKAETNGIWT